VDLKLRSLTRKNQRKKEQKNQWDMGIKKLSPKQLKIAKLAKPFNKITGEDFKKLRSMKKIKRI
jgi:hypothetical protein